MAQLFAFHLAEDVPPIDVDGHYDSEQQLWVGQSQPTATYGTYTNSNTSTMTRPAGYGTGDWDDDQDPDRDVGN